MSELTPRQMAEKFIGADALAGVGYERDLDVATKAIAFDRKQRTDPGPLVVATARALRDREDIVSAMWVLSNEDELFGSYMGPTLDAIQRDHGEWSPSGEPLPPVDAAARFEADVESAIRSEARSAITARSSREYDEHDPRL